MGFPDLHSFPSFHTERICFPLVNFQVLSKLKKVEENYKRLRSCFELCNKELRGEKSEPRAQLGWEHLNDGQEEEHLWASCQPHEETWEKQLCKRIIVECFICFMCIKNELLPFTVCYVSAGKWEELSGSWIAFLSLWHGSMTGSHGS